MNKIYRCSVNILYLYQELFISNFLFYTCDIQIVLKTIIFQKLTILIDTGS